MYLFLGVFAGLAPNTTVHSNDVEVINVSELGEEIVLDSGTLLVNGASVGSSAIVQNGDTIRAIVQSPATQGDNYVSYLTIGGKRVGFVAVSTAKEDTIEYDTAHDSLYPFETISPTWEPNAIANVIRLQDSTVTDTIDLLGAAGQDKGISHLFVADYHRNAVYIIDVDSKSQIRTLTDGTKPTCAVHYYGQTGVRTYSIVAYSETGGIVLYNDEYGLIDSYVNAGVNSMAIVGNTLYASHKNSQIVSTYTIGVGALTKTADLTFPQNVHALHEVAGDLYIAAGTRLYDIAGTVLCTANANIASTSVYGADIYLATARTGQVTKFTVGVNAVDTDTIENAVYISALHHDGSVLHAFDSERKVMYNGIFGGTTETTIGFPVFGTQGIGSMYLANLYSDLPSKYITVEYDYSVNDSAFVDANNLNVGTSFTSGAVTVSSNYPLKVSVISTEPVDSKKNTIPTADKFTANDGDSLTLTLNATYDSADPTLMGYMIGDTYIDILASIDFVDIIPDNFYFPPKIGVPLSSTITSDVLTIAGLDRPIIVTSDATLLINGVVATQPVTLNNGDELSVRVNSSDVNSMNTTAVIEIEGRFTTPFTVRTLSSAETPTVPPVIDFGHTYNHKMLSRILSPTIDIGACEPTTYSLPDHYSAYFIHNGVYAGRSVTVVPDDTLQISLVTTYNMDAPHLIPVVSDYDETYWVAWTAGDTMPDAFDFGSITGLSIKDYVTSDIVNPTGISTNSKITVRVPYGCILFVDDVPHVKGALDWRGVPLRSYYVDVILSPTSNVVLKGYPRTEHGTTHAMPVYIGSRLGYWTLSTYTLQDPFEHNPLSNCEGTALSPIEYVPANVEVVARTLTASVNGSSHVVTAPSTAEVLNAPVVTATSTTDAVAYTSPLLTVGNGLLWDYVKSNILYVQSYETITVSSQLTTTGFLEVQLIYSNNPIEFTIDRKAGVVSNAVYTFTVEHDYEVMPNSTHEFLGKTAEVYTTNFVLFERAENDILEAILFTNNFIEVQISEFSTHKYNLWQVALPYFDEAEIYEQGDFVTFERTFEIYAQGNSGEWSPEVHTNTTSFYEVGWEVDVNLTHNTVEYVPNYESASTSPVVEFKPDVEVFTNYAGYDFNMGTTIVGSSVYEFERDMALAVTNLTVEYQRPSAALTSTNQYEFDIAEGEVDGGHDALYFNIVQPTDVTASGTVAAAYPDFEAVESTVERIPPVGTTHPGYFDTYNGAVDNAHLWGYEDGDYYVAQVPEKGFVWVVKIPCANMCDPNDCPPHGYIHGG